jgi:hypothetical protein
VPTADGQEDSRDLDRPLEETAMHHPSHRIRHDPVRVVVEDEPGLEDRVRQAACRARESDRAVELVEAVVAASDHAARARLIRCMDEALEVARRAAPGVDIRVGSPIELPRPRHG